MNIDQTDSFYLGKKVDPATEKTTDKLVFYDSKDLTTHAMCVGMTGSGKTGLGIALLEEAGLRKIPAIIIDPKGDLTNLLLTFPHLSKEEFLPWIDHTDAANKNLSDEAYAEFIANTWKKGLLSSFEEVSRIQKLKDSVEMVIYTPASSAGIPLSILSSFKAPDEFLRKDKEFMRERILSLTSSLLGLLGIEADPINSREHILISAIIDANWIKGNDLTLTSLIEQIQNPGFDKLGALDLDTFFPQKERTVLAVKLNGLLASKSFQAWTEGESLDIQGLLYTEENKPKLSILTINHLSDQERMFFVTLLLGEFLTWMRRQPGSSSLKAILYMDEIYGFFPPTAMPPSKQPMISLLKTARAFGVGIFLSTQNPVDLDYKGLSNCGTWFIGKLQTERDKLRVLEGLKIASNGELNAATLNKMISEIQKRTFIMRSIHEKDPIIFETRWTMSYLKGPLTLTQIKKLTNHTEEKVFLETEDNALDQSKPFLPKGTLEYFYKPESFIKTFHYKPYLLATANVHFVENKNKIDTWNKISYLFPIDTENKAILLNEGELETDIQTHLEKTAVPNATFEHLPTSLLQEKNISSFQKAFATNIYQKDALTLFHFSDLNLTSKQEESKEDFLKRIKDEFNVKNEEEVQKINAKYEEKIAALQLKLTRADEKVNLQKQHSWIQKIEAFLSFLTTIFQAFLGKRLTKTTISSVGTSIRKAGRITKNDRDLVYREESLKSYEAQIEDLKHLQSEEIEKIKIKLDHLSDAIEEIQIKPKKSDINVDQVALVWKTGS